MSSKVGKEAINTFAGGMNTDLDDSIIKASQYRYAENVRVTQDTFGTFDLDFELTKDQKYSNGKILSSMNSEADKSANDIFIQHLDKNLGDPALFPGTRKAERNVIEILGRLVDLPKTVPDGLAFDIENNLYISCYRPDIIYRYTNEYWVKTDAPDLQVHSIVAYKDEYPILWSAIDGGSWSDGVYKSEDFGETWSIKFAWMNIRDVLVNPLDSNIIYAADSGYGVMISRDGGYNWDLINENLGDSVVFCLAQSKADTARLYAGTQHGVYWRFICSGASEEEEDQEILSVTNSIGSSLEISYCIPSNLSDKEVSIRLFDISGRLVDVLFEGRAKSGLNTLTWNNHTPSSILLLNFRIGDLYITKKVVLIR